MSDFPLWMKPQHVATYIGSAGNGLGFYHIELPQTETTRWLIIQNCGIVLIKKGDISMLELEGELSEIFCKDWSWQIRELTPARFLVRFPPHRRVSDIKNLPSFNLRKEGVQVEVVEWVGELEHFSELREVWIQLEGIPPKWCDWGVFAQMTSGLGLLVEVDCASLFKSFYENVRLRIACRNPRYIPKEMLFELSKKLYMVSIVVKGQEQEQEQDEKKKPDGNDDGGQGDNEDDLSDDDYDDLDDLQEQMDMDSNVGVSGEGLP
jgi:hypothetical protein